MNDEEYKAWREAWARDHGPLPNVSQDELKGILDEWLEVQVETVN